MLLNICTHSLYIIETAGGAHVYNSRGVGVDIYVHDLTCLKTISEISSFMYALSLSCRTGGMAKLRSGFHTSLSDHLTARSTSPANSTSYDLLHRYLIEYCSTLFPSGQLQHDNGTAVALAFLALICSWPCKQHQKTISHVPGP